MKRKTEDTHKAGVDPFPTSISDLHFSISANNFSSTLFSLKHATFSTHNRLRSIQHDSHFVQAIASRYHLPLIANERCGSWYIPPKKKASSAYFKSTDGHFGQWAFSLRRLNLQILETIGAADGCVIVDSTRRGKHMPDALSKTVPIWCTVLNRLLFPGQPEMHQLHTPASAVAPSEHAQIMARLQGFVEDVTSLRLDTKALRSAVKRPLIPSWITPDFENMTSDDTLGHNRVLCCTASRRVEGSEASENGYIQGAADDHEAWSQDLTPSIFWKYHDELLGMMEDDIGNFVQSSTSEEDFGKESLSHTTRINPTYIYIATLLDSVPIQDFDGLIRVSGEPYLPFGTTPQQSASGPVIFQMQCKSGKLGSRALRTQLNSVVSFLGPLYSSGKSPKILIMCHDGRDISVGVALAILCLFYDDQSKPRQIASWESINKSMIRQRLAKITSAKPDANPSRATLQSVHAFLMS